MTPQELKNSILQQAIQGKLVEQRPEEGTAEELYQQIQAEKQRLIQEKKIKKDKPLPEITEEEKPFDIPESWKWVNIFEICSMKQWKTVPTSALCETGYPVYGANGIIGFYNTFNHTLPTLLITCRGATCGNTNITTGKCYVNGNALAVENLSKYINIIYLKYYIDALNLKSMHIITGSAQPQITQNNIKRLFVPLLPLTEQKRIVAKIEELLPLIDRYEAAWSRLEAFNKRFPEDMQKSILQQAIQGKLVEQRPEEGTGEELYRQIQAEKQRLIKEKKIKKQKPLPEITEEEKPFDIPESWKWVRVGEVCTNIQYGTSRKSSSSGKMAVLRMGNIQNGKIDYEKLVYTSDDGDIEKYHIDANDLLFNRTNSKELVGKTAIYKGEIPAIYAGYLVRITPMVLDSDFLNYTMQSKYYWGYCQKVRSDAIGQSNMNAEKLKHFIFPLPPLAEQKRIVAKIEQLLPLCEKLKK